MREIFRRTLAPGLAALLSGSFMWLAAAAFPFWWLSFAAWVPLLWACREASVRGALGYGLLTGTMAVFGGFTWMTELLVRFAGFSEVASLAVHLVFSAYHGLLWALPMALATYVCRGRPVAMVWAFPVAWGATETLMPQVFEVHMAFLWAQAPAWLQTADVFGATGVSMLMVLMNVLLFQVWQQWPHDRRRAYRYLVGLAALAVGIPAYGSLRMVSVEAAATTRPTFQIGVVQGNFGIETRRDAGPLALSTLQAKSAELEGEGAKMVVWGETSYPYSAFSRKRRTDLSVKDQRRIRRGFSVPAVVGLVTVDGRGRLANMWNTAMVVHADDTVGDRYDKNYPLWFGEWVPFVDREWYLTTFPNASHLTLGEGPRVLEVEGYRFGPLICYEDLLEGFTSRTTDLGVHALLAMNNESWFGRSRAQPDHLALSVLRAVEHRLPLVRAVNAGISTVVSPSGTMDVQLEVTDADSDGFRGAAGFVAEVPMMDPASRTIYGRFGRWWRGLICLGCAAVVVWAAWGRQKRPSP